MKRHILVVDDEEGIRELYRMELEGAGYGVFTAADSKRALKILEDEKIHLVVLDIKLKGESGLDLLQRVSSNHQKIPVILSTAYTSYKSDFSSWLAEGYVVKSTDPGELLAEIKRVLKRFYDKGASKA